MTNQPKSWILAGFAILAGAVACGGSDSGGPPASGRKTVLVANNAFQPVTTTISAGDTVLWSWSVGSLEHNIIPTSAATFTAKGNDVVPGGGTVGVDYFNAGTTHQVIFGAAGTYEYYCSQHGTSSGAPGGNTGMQGVIQVNP